jgi:hypothetical protein
MHNHAHVLGGCLVSMIDQYFEKHEIDTVNSMKVDHEAAALPVRGGAGELPSSTQRSVVMVANPIEWRSRYGYSPQGTIRFLGELPQGKCDCILIHGSKRARVAGASILGDFQEWIKTIYVVSDIRGQRNRSSAYLA